MEKQQPLNAGILFTDKRYVLAGWQLTKGGQPTQGGQPNKSLPTLSGFGGKPDEQDEIPYDTALREVIEELLGIYGLPISYLRILQDELPSPVFHVVGDYLVFIHSFDSLFLLIKKIYKAGLSSPFYKTQPTSIDSLLFQRIPIEGSEVSELALLPMKQNLNVCEYFRFDINTILAENKDVAYSNFVKE